MSDILKRIDEALDEYTTVRKKYGSELAKIVFANTARTLLQEASEEIKWLLDEHNKWVEAFQKSNSDWALEKARAEAAEAKLAVALAELDRLVPSD